MRHKYIDEVILCLVITDDSSSRNLLMSTMSCKIGPMCVTGNNNEFGKISSK
jgi:hypothetical protein